MKEQISTDQKSPPGIFSLLKPYRAMVIMLILFALFSNGLNLWLPRMIGHGIDAYNSGNFSYKAIIVEFTVVALIIFVFSYLQGIVQTFASERVARDLRTRITRKISEQSFVFIEKTNPSKLLTNLTSDVDSVKLFISQAIVSIVSSIFIIIGATILLLSINWRLGLTTICIIPIIGGAYYIVLGKVKVLFKKSREVIDWLNKVINESILGAALIRVINSQQLEYEKFFNASTQAKNIGISILRLFAWLIPIIVFTANMAGLTILALGGHYVIKGSMTIGDFAAFNSYLALLIFPILVIGFMSNVIAQATASFGRISQVLNAEDPAETGTLTTSLTGAIDVQAVSIMYGEKCSLKDISFKVEPGSKIAIIGPTAAGKSQLLYLLTGLIHANSGKVLYDGKPIEDYQSEAFHAQVGFVFQDSIMFNMSIRENIAFSDLVTDESLAKSIATAELKDFIDAMPEGLNTKVSERGLSLSGGQKQRIMLARALALNPKILLLDDFTARVDPQTEQKILANITANYPGLTLISVTQKIAAVQHYEKIILLMQGELLAEGTHEELMQKSPEYIQILNSQESTSNYEL
ncbi:ATP-binding cassette subfamily B protein [Pedobacter cryoconitis]|uniref:ATP-binding cassette subfamily B protein n=1 Tax=Pedobacter cryoconitis TaxID=188932 RepID=A0A7W9DHX0_9SPHI|nr:ABC transporter ATP-binding protein [Pedobacter cryoconitis]MBB5619104.1 ATP-binding cassette subfamily B protein [Pedobacter cryoconitis]MBB5644398.1 ATP-binding cassette subfamily B protein [Pedobacter cryoconitis]